MKAMEISKYLRFAALARATGNTATRFLPLVGQANDAHSNICLHFKVTVRIQSLCVVPVSTQLSVALL